MSPFLQFRLWLRDGPAGERVLAGVGTVAVVALVVLALIPVTRRSDNGVTAATGATASANGSTPASGGAGSGTAPAKPGAANPGGRSSVAGGGTGTGGGASSPSASAGATGPCSGTKGSSLGVTPTEVKIVTTNISLGGSIGNGAFDIRGDLQAIAQAAADDINEKGGVACGRKIALKQYDVN